MKLTTWLIKGLFLLLILALPKLNAQNDCNTDCSIQCIGQINVSLDQNCSTEITPAMGAVGVEYYCNEYYTVDLYDSYGYHLPNTTVGIEYHGETLTYKITETECANSCWGTIYVEYKYPPQIECPEDLTLACGGLNLLDLPGASGGCADFEVVLYEQTRHNYDCNEFYSSVVTRTYKAYDSYGNESYCSHDIYIKRLDIEEIIFPGPATISCNDPLMRFDDNGYPIPWYKLPLTGSGSGEGIPIICDPEVTDGLVCPSSMDLSGVPIIPSGGAIAIVENPDIYGPEYIINEITDENNALLCNAILTYTDVEIPNIPCKRKILRQWEVLEWWCNRELSGSASQLISIVDDEAPHFYCPDDKTVSTDYECGGHVYLESVDVYDGCFGTPEVSIQYGNGTLQSNGGYVDLNLGHNYLTYIVSDGCYNSSTCQVVVTVEDRQAPVAICEAYKVVSIGSSSTTIVYAEPFDNGSWDECGIDRFEVRRMDSLCVASDTLFDESVSFCCSDAGTEVMVVFRAYDWNQNFNDCMVRVEVQDKLNPSIQCPPDQTIQCQDVYDINNLSLMFGEAVISDNCSSAPIVETVESNVNQCGVGEITRFIDVINNDSTVIAHCKQLISVENHVPYLGSSITWPLDYVAENVCEVTNIDPEDLPEGYDFPSFGVQDECTLLGYQYEDKIFSSANGCAHIKRTWTVINWCGTSNGSYEIWTIPEPQLIEIFNTTPPVIEEQEDLAFESQDVDCEGDSIRIERTATDDCEFLGWYYVLYNDNGDTLEYGLSNILETYLPVGNYTVEWEVQDGCGNYDVDFQELSMINTKAPTPVCINGLSASLVAMDLDNDGVLETEMVELWASDFDSGSTYSCGNPITLSLASDTTVKNVIFDCEDIGRNEVQLWVTDVITGYQDYCVSFIDIQDNNNVDICPDSLNKAVIEGDIFTEELQNIEGVFVSMGANLPAVITNEYGHYGFGNMPIGGQYEIRPSLNDNFLNGVSTLDLILIQRHILGLEKIESPYKLLSADINGDGEISSTDLIELRKLILGIYDTYPSNESWRFVDAQHQFIDDWDPWAGSIPDAYNIDYLNGYMDIDFVGMKVGDVTADAQLRSNISEEDNLDRKVIEFEFGQAIENGIHENSIPVYANNYNEVLGWQTILSFDQFDSQVLSVSAGSLEIDPDKHINLEGRDLRISYNRDNPETISDGEVLFYIEFDTNFKPESNALLRIQEIEYVASELYKANGETYKIELSKADKKELIEIVSINPNPWIQSTNLHYKKNEDGMLIWEFYDVSGSLVFRKSEFSRAGENVLRLDRSEFDRSGLIYIRMISEKSITEQKMILLD